MCHQMGIPLLGKVPLDPGLGKAAEEGRSIFQNGEASACLPALQDVVGKIMAAVAGTQQK